MNIARAISNDAMRGILESLPRTHQNPSVQIRSLRRRLSPYASSCPIELLSIRLSSGQRLDLLFKELSPASRLESARGVRPGHVENPAREILVYENILDAAALGTPRFFGAINERASGTHCLFLENVRGVPLWQKGDIGIWTEAARWLARFHARRFRIGPATRGALLKYDVAYYKEWMRRAVAYRVARGRTAAERRQWSRLVSRYDRVVQPLASLPAHVIHGEFFPSNVLVRAGRRRGRICPIDWEMTAWGPGVIDLAALTAGNWTADERRAMLRAYHVASTRAGAAFCEERELEALVTLAQIHLAVQMLGWARGWTPPAHHAADWLSTSLQLAQRAGIV